MTKRSLCMVLLAALFILAGCSTPAPIIESRQNPGANLENYKTFAMLPLPDSIPGAKPGALQQYGWTAQQGIKEALRDKGYVEAPLRTADFAVGLKGSVVPTIQVQEHGFNYGFYSLSSFWGSDYPEMRFGVTQDPEKDQNNYTALSLEIFDVKSREMVWAGWVMGNRKKGTPVTHELIKYRIRQILESYPNKQKR